MLIDFDYLVSQLYVQHCTFVEIGEGICSLFVELTLDLGSSCKKPTTRQMFFGNCLCSEFRGWQLCSYQLALQRPDDCVFEEGVDCPSSSARVHRRLCDITGMSQWNTQCNCSTPLAGLQQEPLCGFRTCFANPMPASICTPRTVCGTARCDISLHGSLYAIKCDRKCKDHQSFCEQTGPTTSEKRKVTSEWTEWQSLSSEDKTSIQQFQAECLDSEGKPAFDCIGPGALCCGLEEVDCICEVKQEDGHLKVFRYTITLLGSKESEHLSLRVRSIGLKGQAKVWNRFMDIASKEDESDSLFSSPKLKGKMNKGNLQLDSIGIGRIKPKESKTNVHVNVYENISQLLGSTILPYTQLVATIESKNDLQQRVHSFVNQQSQLLTPSSSLEKQEGNKNLTNSLNNSLQHLGGLKNVSFGKVNKEENVNLPSDDEKNHALDSETNVQSSDDNAETHDQIKEEISQYHFTLNPSADSKKVITTTGSKAKDKNLESFNDYIDEENKNVTDQNNEISEVNNKNEDNGADNILLNKENPNAIVENKKSPKEILEINNSQNHETNEDNNDILDQVITQTDMNILQDGLKSIHKDSLTDNEITMEQNYFQNEIDFNGKISDNNNKLIRNETLINHTADLNGSSKPNLKNIQNITQKNIDDEKLRNNSISEKGRMNEYATTIATNLTTPFAVSGFTLSNNKNISSKTDGDKNSEKKFSNESKKINDLNSNSSEPTVSKKKGKYEKSQSEDCVSISDTSNTLTNQTNVQANNDLTNKTLLTDVKNDTIENKTTTTVANGLSKTKILSHVSDVSTVSSGDSTTECITIKLDSEHKQNDFQSKANNSTENPEIKKTNSITQSKTSNITNQVTISQIKTTQVPRDSVKGKLTKSKEHILMDQKDALQTALNLNPKLSLEEDRSKSQNTLYDEPEPVLKDLDKDDVDDNMADVLNNMIGMKHYCDKLSWSEKKDKDRNTNSKVFTSHKGDLETNESPIKMKKTKKKIH